MLHFARRFAAIVVVLTTACFYLTQAFIVHVWKIDPALVQHKWVIALAMSVVSIPIFRLLKNEVFQLRTMTCTFLHHLKYLGLLVLLNMAQILIVITLAYEFTQAEGDVIGLLIALSIVDMGAYIHFYKEIELKERLSFLNTSGK